MTAQLLMYLCYLSICPLKVYGMMNVLYIRFPALGFGQGQTEVGQCQENDRLLRRAKQQTY